MQRFLFILIGLMSMLFCRAQYGNTFNVPNADGKMLYYGVTSDVGGKREVDIINMTGGTYYSGTLNVPSTVTHGGKTYTVTGVGNHAFDHSSLDALHLPETITKLGYQIMFGAILKTPTLKQLHFPSKVTVFPNNLLWMTGLEEVWLPTNLRWIEPFSLYIIGGGTTKGIYNFASTKVEKIMSQSILWNNMDRDFAILPPTIRVIESSAFQIPLQLDELRIPQSMDSLGSNNYNIAHDVYIEGTTPFILANNAFGTQPTLKIHMEVDRTFAFATAAGWSSYVDKFVEEVKLGSTGYTSYYLENENFKVPAGCTAYIITGITKSSNPALPDQANVTAFTAGKIIPKQTGFILQGTPNSTVVYQANVTGTEESVAGNWLIGTATEQEFSSAGHKYYVLANGDEGIGFYKQGTRKGASIKLQPHRAGLRLADAVAPAKGLIIDFDAAREETETTGIRDVRPSVQSREDIIYDLKGRRVKNPGRGIYIVNGKKVVRE